MHAFERSLASRRRSGKLYSSPVCACVLNVCVSWMCVCVCVGACELKRVCVRVYMWVYKLKAEWWWLHLCVCECVCVWKRVCSLEDKEIGKRVRDSRLGQGPRVRPCRDENINANDRYLHTYRKQSWLSYSLLLVLDIDACALISLLGISSFERHTYCRCLQLVSR
jgi:hypothetical protein